MDQLDELLKTMKNSTEPLPAGFENRVLDNWFQQQAKPKNDYTVFLYAAAACLIAFTCINILSLHVLDSPADDVSVHPNTTIEISSETEFAEAYGLIETASYYTLNK